MKDYKLKVRLIWIHAFRPIFRAVRDVCFRIKGFLKADNIRLTLAILLFAILGIVGAIFYPIVFHKDNDLAIGYSQIVSGFIAGSLTMIGVVFTIRRQDSNLKTERRLAIKPYIVFGKEDDDNIITKTIKFGAVFDDDSCFDSQKIYTKSKEIIGNNECVCQYNPFYIHNADFSECSIFGIRYREHYYFLETEILLRKNTTYCIDFTNYLFLQEKRNELKSPILGIADMRDNDYFYELDTDEGGIASTPSPLFNIKNKKMKLLTYAITRIDEYPFSYKNIVRKQDIINEKNEKTPYFEGLKKLFKLKELIEEHKTNTIKFDEYRKKAEKEELLQEARDNEQAN